MKTKALVMVLVAVGIPVGTVVGLLLGIQLGVQSGWALGVCALPFMALAGWAAVRIGNRDRVLGREAVPLVKFGIPGGLALCVGFTAVKAGDLQWGLPILAVGIALSIPLLSAAATEEHPVASEKS
jgi:hypothetical protein